MAFNDDCNLVILYLLNTDNYTPHRNLDSTTKKINPNISGLVLIIEELNRLGTLEKILSYDGHASYLLKQSIRAKINMLTGDFKDKPYDFLLSEEKVTNTRKVKKEDLDFKNAERVYKTYPTTQAITWITFIVMLFLSFLKLAEVLHIWPYHK